MTDASVRAPRAVVSPKDAAFDEFVAANEHPEMFFRSGRWPRSEHAQGIYQEWLVAQGLLEPGEPTPYEHRRFVRRVTLPFTPDERRMIRVRLGLPGPEVDEVVM